MKAHFASNRHSSPTIFSNRTENQSPNKLSFRFHSPTLKHIKPKPLLFPRSAPASKKNQNPSSVLHSIRDSNFEGSIENSRFKNYSAVSSLENDSKPTHLIPHFQSSCHINYYADIQNENNRSFHGLQNPRFQEYDQYFTDNSNIVDISSDQPPQLSEAEKRNQIIESIRKRLETNPIFSFFPQEDCFTRFSETHIKSPYDEDNGNSQDMIYFQVGK
jgi:hypothetical protein